MRVFLGRVALALAACVCIGPLTAAGAEDTFPTGLSSYPTAGLAAREAIVDTQADRASFDRYFSFQEESTPQVQSYWPVLYSALVPGLGELTMGYEKRGIALMVMEVAAWSGYFVKHSDGLDKRDEYEAFADAHWDMQKWLYDHPCSTADSTLESVEECGKASSGSGSWPGYIPWVSKEEDKQHYYENIGKYDWYISGWADWDAARVPYAEHTDLRTQYRDMRAESNNALDDANAFVWVSVAARAFSIAETAILVHNRRDNGGSGQVSPVSLRARPRGYTGGEVALEVRFK